MPKDLTLTRQQATEIYERVFADLPQARNFIQHLIQENGLDKTIADLQELLDLHPSICDNPHCLITLNLQVLLDEFRQVTKPLTTEEIENLYKSLPPYKG
jgi:hypothetical protein